MPRIRLGICTIQENLSRLPVKVPPAIQLDLAAPDLADCIARFPRTAGIYALETASGAPHLTWSANLRARLVRLFVAPSSARENLLDRLRKNSALVLCWPTASKLESALLMHTLAKKHFPQDYLLKQRLRMPWFLTLSSDDAFPRLMVTNRLPSKPGQLFGPFLTRDLAQAYEQSVLGLFQIRRCVESLAPAPEHPGCIYGEMSQCLRPCQAAVTLDEYATEAARVAEFLSSNGNSMAASLLLARDRAAEATEFEQAAYLHKRLERVKEAASARDPTIREVAQFSGVALTRGSGPREFRLWPMFEGFWQEPLILDFSSDQSPSVSLDRELRERLSNALADPLRVGNRIEELAIFSRWYYSSWRDGQWFPFRTVADLNYRKLVREISNLSKATAEAPVHSAPC